MKKYSPLYFPLDWITKAALVHRYLPREYNYPFQLTSEPGPKRDSMLTELMTQTRGQKMAKVDNKRGKIWPKKAAVHKYVGISEMGEKGKTR